MSMISDIVDRLRTESKSMGKYGTDYMATLLMQASDTIIMLSEKARADRSQGEWIDPAAEDCYRCSVCEKYTQMETPRLLYHYCPRCGARMKGTNNDQ